METKEITVIMETEENQVIFSGSIWTITKRLEVLAFRPYKFVFQNPSDWMIRDFLIGNKSQLFRHNIPADMFKDSLFNGRCETVQTAQDMIFTFVAQKNGLRFKCEITGPSIAY